jgi:hypothetical protein
MSSARQATPLFLSSSRDISNDTDETSFTCRLTPPLRISEQAKKVSAYIDSATIPYTFPNLDSSTSSVVVRIPLRNPSNPSADSGEVTLSLQTGVFNWTEVAEQINKAVNTWLHTNGYPVLMGSWQYYDFSADVVTTKASSRQAMMRTSWLELMMATSTRIQPETTTSGNCQGLQPLQEE